MKYVAKPILVFSIGMRKFIQCRVTDGVISDVLNRTLWIMDGELCIPIKLTGVSTASGIDGLYDFAFEGAIASPRSFSREANIVEK